MNRKAFLHMLAAGGASFLGRNALARIPGSDQTNPVSTSALLPWGRLRFRARDGDDKDWGVHPHGDLNLIDHLGANTTINLARKWNVADVASLPDMSAYPFLFMHAELPPVLNDAERANLREYLLRGGFLFAEDCVIGQGNLGQNRLNDFFFRHMAETELRRILPEARLELLPKDHPVFHSIFDFRNGIPHMQGTPHGLHGLILNGRVVALLSPSDIHCGWTNGDRWFGPGATTRAMQMGANIYAFAMTQT
ncbi:MAG: hypothetical protein K0R17_2358 [Rariglobus sp.]|jgi:hypothetical protein|nr:hypothetical protein [Rariglobus sp.]